MVQNTKVADAKNGNWELFLLGHVNEKTRKALIFNILTKEELNAKVSINDDKTKTTYIVTEAVDPKKNMFVDFTKSFVVNHR